MSKAEKRELETKTKSKVSEKIKSKEKAVVLFYATWCPFSQRFLPVFEEYSKGNPNECIRVIVDEEPDFADECDIQYYPTVIIFKNGKVEMRLDAEPGVGLNKKQLNEFTEKSKKR